ncbi:MAG: 50S ribosomal protein L3 [Candidatus Latescibacteria bacterium]|nr:50S ribosomal protein L3 [Candidatus Latescibacterota bacterium]
MIGLIGKKIGMSQFYDQDGVLCPATVLEVGPCAVVQVKKQDGRDGYNAVKLGFKESSKITKSLMGVFASAGLSGMKLLREFRVNDVDEFEAGSVLDAGIFTVGEKVMVRGRTKGRGFAGVVKRHNFSGGDDTHGCRSNRVPGSIGASADPSRVFKGKKMPGHYGSENKTVKGLEVLLVDAEKNVIFVKGAVPGARNGIVYVTKQP